MWPEHTRGWRQRWRGFRDDIGDRVVVETVSGMRSEGLLLVPELCADDGVLSYLAHAVAEGSDIRHPAVRNPRQLERLSSHGRAVLVSDYTPGLRLAAWLASRQGVPPSTGTILHIAKQILDGLTALASHAPAMHHGALGLARIILAADGRILLAEAGVGLLLGRRSDLDADRKWRQYRVASPVAPPRGHLAEATDVCQLGVVVLELLLGRPIAPNEYPGNLALLLGAAQETDFLGNRAPLGGALFEWLSVLLGLDDVRGGATIALATEMLDELLTDEGGYVAASLGLDVQTEPLETFPFPPPQMPSAPGLPPLPPQGSWSTAQGDSQRAAVPLSRAEDTAPATVPLRDHEHGVKAAVAAGTPAPAVAASAAAAASVGDAALQSLSESIVLRPDERVIAGQFGTVHEPVEAPAGSAVIDRGFFGTGRNDSRATVSPLRVKRHWRTMLPWGGAAIVITVLVAGGAALWTHWVERTVGQATGTLNVSSKPEGATILIDGIERGKAPLSLVVAPGSHRVTAKSAQGAGEVVHDIVVGETHDLTVPLQFGSDPGFLDINTDPPGAVVRLDGELRGRSPLSLADLPPGEHELTVELGAAQLQRRFTLAPAERLTLYVPLAGWLTVRSRVPVEVLDRGRAVGLSNDGRLLVPAGRRRLQFVNNEYGVNTSQDVVIRAGQQADLTVPLTHGGLSVTTDIPADVWVDGQSVGRTPTGNIDVPVGEHEVLVSHPELGDQRLTVIVGMGAPTRLSVRLDPGLPRRPANQRSPKRSGISAAR